MTGRVRVRRRPASFSTANDHPSHEIIRSSRPGYQVLDCKLDENEVLTNDGILDGTVIFNGTYTKNSMKAWASPLSYFSRSPVLPSMPLATILPSIFSPKACLYGPQEKESSMGPSVEYQARLTNTNRDTWTKGNPFTRQEGYPPPHRMDHTQMDSQSRQPHHALEISSEENLTSPNQKEFLMAVRQFAARLCMVAVVGSFLVSILCTESNDMNTTDLTTRSARGLPRAEPLPLTRKEEEIAKQEDEVTLEEMGGLQKLRKEFEDWMKHHQREYDNEDERENRFQVWRDNHKRTIQKNKRHGPCPMMKQQVFGSNHFKDLTAEEFQSKYLTGYSGPRADEIPARKLLRSDHKTSESQPLQSKATAFDDVLSSTGRHDPTKIPRHASVQERYMKQREQAPLLHKTYYQRNKSCQSSSSSNYYNGGSSSSYQGSSGYWNGRFLKTYYDKNKSSQNSDECNKNRWQEADKTNRVSNQMSSSSCTWYEVSCNLKRIFSPIYGSISSNSESKYTDSYSYPSSIDWRDLGAVTSIHSQGNCGACWAITATETIESAHAINTGELLDLSETEIIMCDDTCVMCDGGWPQNAYKYAIKNKGLPLEKTLSYDGDFLMTVTSVMNGESDELSESYVESYKEETCPAEETSGTTRYGAVSSYAYATDRCVCYTDGSGCDCDKQDEALAVMNLASYGPATVCLEAGTWQDYTGGIITAESGCSSAFLDMNHCVQAVGYAFRSSDDEKEGDDDTDQNHSGDEKGTREGYWIIRNQWTKYWGMDGYAFVAMGENTCGVLNDMTQVFLED